MYLYAVCVGYDMSILSFDVEIVAVRLFLWALGDL